MVLQTPVRELFSELYLVDTAHLSPFYAWRIETHASEIASLGRKLAYRLSRLAGGHWIWAENLLVTDKKISELEVKNLLASIWGDPSAKFKDVNSLYPVSGWKPLPETVAEFVAFGLCSDLERSLTHQMSKHRRTLRNAFVNRIYDLHGWNVNGQAALSISVSSQIISTKPFGDFAASVPQEDLRGMMVKDKTSTLKGEIINIVGRLGTHRQRLLGFTKRDAMRQILENAPDDEMVVRVQTTSREGYDYPVSALQIIVRTQDYEMLGIDGQAALSTLQMKPDARMTLVTEIADHIHAQGWIRATPIGSYEFPNAFLTSEDIGLMPLARLGDGFVTNCEPRNILSALQSHPPYKSPSHLGERSIIRIGVLNLIGDNPSIPKYLDQLRQQFRDIHIDIVFTGAARPQVGSSSELQSAVSRLATDAPDILAVLLPGFPNETDDEHDLYNQVKVATITRDIQTQVIYERTLGKDFALANLVLGILAKCGVIPYTLAHPLPYADMVAGIDIAREKTQRRSGSVNLAAITRIYQANGDFLHYFLHDSPIEGETLPMQVLRRLFPPTYFAAKRVVIHRDGLFRGDEINNLLSLATEMESSFHLVEVIKSGAPRLYRRSFEIERPTKGSIFKVNEREALVVSTLPIHKNSTPRPLQIRTQGDLTIEQAVHSVLAMTLLHHGSMLAPRLPVTLHYSDKIGYLALRGIKPNRLDGDIPFWM